MGCLLYEDSRRDAVESGPGTELTWAGCWRPDMLFLFYLVPGLLGMKTGYPLYVVGSSTYGTVGGFLMPGLLMGLLQFGWLAVNSAVSTSFYASGVLDMMLRLERPNLSLCQ